MKTRRNTISPKQISNDTKKSYTTENKAIRWKMAISGLHYSATSPHQKTQGQTYPHPAHAALEALKTNDFVYMHIEASDEAGHEGDVDLKIKTIEYLDNRAVRIIYEETQKWDEPVAIAILPDHPTPCSIRTHTNTPVPFLIYKPGEQPDSVTTFDEFSVSNGKYGILEKDQFIKEFLND